MLVRSSCIVCMACGILWVSWGLCQRILPSGELIRLSCPTWVFLLGCGWLNRQIILQTHTLCQVCQACDLFCDYMTRILLCSFRPETLSKQWVIVALIVHGCQGWHCIFTMIFLLLSFSFPSVYNSSGISCIGNPSARNHDIKSSIVSLNQWAVGSMNFTAPDMPSINLYTGVKWLRDLSYKMM